MKLIYNLILLFWIPVLVPAQSIVNTKHNLSVMGPGTVKATVETEICLFCHTAHNSRPSSPLWNRSDPGSNYTLYTSSTMKALPGQPSGSSILCLSCHDGTIALGSVLSRSSIISFASAVNMPAGRSNITTDLRNDHPVSFTYDAGLASLNTEIKNPAGLVPQIKLENDQLQCTSCHDPHKNIYTDFLVASTQYSNLCNACHQQTNWTTSSHNTSVKTWNNAAPNPWPYTPWTTVAENACENCHNPHNSGGLTRLLKYQAEEDNCLDCHNGNVATKNIQAEFSKSYKHNVYGYTGVHDPAETAIVNTKHVECADCHNAHAAKNQPATAPAVKGSNIGVQGINQNGIAVNPVSFEYEICYRCHTSNPPTGISSPRKIVQSDLRLEFDPTNPSFHPVVAPGVNTTISGLISPLTASSQIYCTDCHASNGTNSPAGPHGSIYPQILKYNYDRTSGYVNSYLAYELCYQCHDQNTTITNHNLLSVSGTHGTITSCNNCHDPHGISSTQGSSLNNKYLLNFNSVVVTNNSNNLLNWTNNSPGHGTCNLSCHGHDHINSGY
jgi:predicted CXXCH cytochrome family protein